MFPESEGSQVLSDLSDSSLPHCHNPAIPPPPLSSSPGAETPVRSLAWHQTEEKDSGQQQLPVVKKGKADLLSDIIVAVWVRFAES